MLNVDFCEVCNSFKDVYRYKRHWLCKDCPKTEIDKKIEEKEVNTIISKPEKFERKIKKSISITSLVKEPKVIEPRVKKVSVKSLEKKERKPLVYKKSCKNDLLKHFNKNVDEIFTSGQIIELFQGVYNYENIKNALSTLAKEGSIYSRKINLKGKIVYAIYGKNPNKIRVNIEDENRLKIKEHIIKNYPITTKQLAEHFNCSDTAITKTLKCLDNEIEKYFHMNRNFYFPKIYRIYSISEIIKKTHW